MLPIANMFSNSYSMPTISYFLMLIRRTLSLIHSAKLNLPTIETDWSWGMIQSACMAANNMNITEYLKCVFHGQGDHLTTIHMCSQCTTSSITIHWHAPLRLPALCTFVVWNTDKTHTTRGGSCLRNCEVEQWMGQVKHRIWGRNSQMRLFWAVRQMYTSVKGWKGHHTMKEPCDETNTQSH